MMTEQVTVAAIQMCSTNNVNENLQTAARLIRIAAEHGAKLAVLPEMFVTMDDATKKMICEIQGNGPIQTFLAKEALENKIWIVGGTIPLATETSNKFSAACLVYDDEGTCVARYNKMHLFDVKLSDQEIYHESLNIEPGQDIVVIDSPIGKLGIAVCFDIRFPDQFKIMSQRGAEVIIIPAAFTMKTGRAHWEILMRSRAIDNFCYMVAACQSGKHSNGRETYGHSMIVEPWGKIIACQEKEGEGIVYGTINVQNVYHARKIIPVLAY